MGRSAIMSVTGELGKHEAIQPGETIGPFKLIDITRDDLTLEWNGQRVRKQLWELQNRSLPTPDAGGDTWRARSRPRRHRSQRRRHAKRAGRSHHIRFARRASPDDSTPVGTVVDGFKKVSSRRLSVPHAFGTR